MDIALFKTLFPEFALVSDAIILAHYAEAELLYKSDCNKEAILRYITAHLLSGYGSGCDNGMPSGGTVSSATIGAVSVSFESTGKGRSEYSLFLASTPYGQHALALMKACNPAGKYIGGNGEAYAMRRQRF